MKTNLLKTALLAASFLGVVSSASAETVHANIPFAFYANGKAMPAGTYTVQTIGGATPVLLFVNDATSEKAMAFARTASDSSGNSSLALIIKTASKTYELSMTAPASSLKGALLTLTPGK
jgi:hypothetical protein